MSCRVWLHAALGCHPVVTIIMSHADMWKYQTHAVKYQTITCVGLFWLQVHATISLWTWSHDHSLFGSHWRR